MMMNSARISSALVLTISVFCGSAAKAQEQAPTIQVPPAQAPLISRGQTKLNLAGARLVLDAAVEAASQRGFRMNVAVVDDGGHLLAFARMDGARPASANTAMTKAITAATFRQETGPLPPGGEPDILLNISVQNAAAASGGKITTLKGGVPIVFQGQIIGAVGVGGGSGEQDAEVAKAGIEALLRKLETQSK